MSGHKPAAAVHGNTRPSDSFTILNAARPHAGDIGRETFRAQTPTTRIQPFGGQRRHRFAPAVEWLAVHCTVEHAAAARATGALCMRLRSGLFHGDPMKYRTSGQEMMPRLASHLKAPTATVRP